MRFIFLPLPQPLPARWHTISSRRTRALLHLATEQEKLDYVKKHPGWGRLKPWLTQVSFGKCWYCEAKTNRSPLDVDHFRPKLGVTVHGSNITTHKGYYWLAYEWTNFRLSCQRCNRPENDEHDILRGKANEFPLKTEVNRCNAPTGSMIDEEPKLLDPCDMNDCALLLHAIDGEVKPAGGYGTWEYQRALYTIDLLGLNSWNVPESKRASWQALNIIIKLSEKAESTLDAQDQIRMHINDKHEYSSYLRTAVATYRDKVWVESLL